MGLPLRQERRTDSLRLRVAGPLPGSLLDLSRTVRIHARPIDVSPRGLGLLVEVALTPGAHFWFIAALPTGECAVKLEVVYCHSHLGIDNLYHCGFFVRGPDDDLTAIFTQLGAILGPEGDA